MRFLGSLAIISSLSLVQVAQAKTFEVDTKASHVQWTGKKKLVTSEHTGKLMFKSGEVTYSDKGAPEKATFVVAMNSLTNEDLTDAKYNAKLVGHLKSDDFFSVDKHPEAKLVIEKFAVAGTDKYTAEGQLTIKGITKPAKMAGTFTAGKGENRTAVVDMQFDRASFDVRYGSGKFFQNLGDKIIADEVDLKVQLTLKPQGKKTALR